MLRLYQICAFRLVSPCSCRFVSSANARIDSLLQWLSHSKKQYCELCGHVFHFQKGTTLPIPQMGRPLLIHSPLHSLSCRYTGRSTATQAYTQNASGRSSAFHASIPGCNCGIHMACPPAFGHDRSVAKLFPLWFSIVSTSPLRTYLRPHKSCLDLRAMMVAGRTPVVANANGTTVIQHQGNATAQALSFWQIFQSFFDSNSASVAEQTTAGMTETNAGIVRRGFAALFRLHHRILSLATIRWSA